MVKGPPQNLPRLRRRALLAGLGAAAIGGGSARADILAGAIAGALLILLGALAPGVL